MMGLRGLLVALMGFVSAQPAIADIRPVARGDAAILVASSAIIRPVARAVPATVPTLTSPTPKRPALRPFDRPELTRTAATTPLRRAEQNLFAFSPTAPVLSLRPAPRTAAFIQVMADRQAAIQRGQVCGDPAIQGQAIGDVPGRGQCGIADAVQIKSVSGIRLQPAARMDCTTAQALRQWIDQGVKPATDNQAVSLRVVSGYACRYRNSASAGRLSEHAFGRAIDIAGIGLQSGREITLLTDWNSQRDGAALRQMWRAACGPFGTVLGPESNRWHRDHFHFDTARYRSGPYCR